METNMGNDRAQLNDENALFALWVHMRGKVVGKVYMHKHIQMLTCETSGSMLSPFFSPPKPVMSSETLMAWG